MQLVGIIPGIPGYLELVVVLMVGLLLFGRRLPEVGRSVGRTIVEFKKGIREVKDDVNTASTSNPPAANQIDPPASTAGQAGNAPAVSGDAGASPSPAGDSAAATPSAAGDKAPPDQT